MLPHKALGFSAFTVRLAIRTPRVSGTGSAQCISRGFTLLSNCVVQRMRAWSLPALLFLSEPVCRFVGRRPDGCAHRGEATRPHALRHPSRRISLGSRRNSPRCARTAPDSPRRVVSACDNPPQLIRGLKPAENPSGQWGRPSLPSAPSSLPPQSPVRPILPYSPPTPFRPSLLSAPVCTWLVLRVPRQYISTQTGLLGPG